MLIDQARPRRRAGQARRERLRRRRRGPPARRRRARRLPARRSVGAERHDVLRVGVAGDQARSAGPTTSARSCSATRSRTSSRRSSSRRLDVDVGFYLGADDVAAARRSRSITADARRRVEEAVRRRSRARLPARTSRSSVNAGNDAYTAIVARLPGEAGAQQAYYAVFVEAARGARLRRHARGASSKSDLSFENFPWLLVGGGFLSCSPSASASCGSSRIARCAGSPTDAVQLAKDESERLAEDAHGGKFGSIARRVNIHIDKLGRDAKSAKQEPRSAARPRARRQPRHDRSARGRAAAVAPGRSRARRAAAAVGVPFHDPAAPAPPTAPRRRAAAGTPPPPVADAAAPPSSPAQPHRRVRAPMPQRRRRVTPTPTPHARARQHAAASPRRRHPRRGDAPDDAAPTSTRTSSRSSISSSR